MSSQGGKSAGKSNKGKPNYKGQTGKKSTFKKSFNSSKETPQVSVSSKYKFHPMGDNALGTPKHTYNTVLEHLLDSLG